MTRSLSLLALVLAPACSLVDLSSLAGDGGGDAASPTDASDVLVPEAGDASDGGGSFSCDASPHAFCDDFDHGALGSLWSSQNVYGGGVLAFAAGLSPPNSLHSSAAANANGAGAALYLTLVRTAQTITCGFDVRVASGAPQAFVLVFSNPSTGGGYGLRLNLGASGARLTEFSTADGGETDTNVQPLAGLTPNVWTNVFFLVQPFMKAAVSVGGAPSTEIQLATPTGAKLETVVLSEDYGPTGFDIEYDDVYCDVQ